MVHSITAQVSLGNAFLTFQSLYNTKFEKNPTMVQNKIISSACTSKLLGYMGTKTIPKVNMHSVLDQSCRSSFTFSDTKHWFAKHREQHKLILTYFKRQ